MLNRKTRNILEKIFGTLVATIFISIGVLTLVQGELVFSNYWGGVIFAPLGILLGIFILYILWFKWKDYEKNRGSVKSDSNADDFLKM